MQSPQYNVPAEYLPSLFSYSQYDDVKTPVGRAGTPPRESSVTSLHTRRSLTPGASLVDVTPSRPPPLQSLNDLGPADAFPAASRPMAVRAEPSASIVELAAPMRVEDTWVTVFGFQLEDEATVLQEFQRCGDVLEWTRGDAPRTANFLHIRFQNKYGAQRALLKNGEQLSRTLIIGVKPMDPRHRPEASEPGTEGLRQPVLPSRSYRVDVAQSQAMPQPTRSVLQKLSEFVLGV